MTVRGASRPVFYGWIIVVALGVTTIISYGTTQYLFGLLIDPIAREFGWSRAAIGAAYSGTVLVSGFAGLGLAFALDRLGARALMSLGSIVSGVSLLLLAHVQTLTQWGLLWTLGLGLGAALTQYPVSFTVLANWFDRRRPHALSVLTFMGAFASTIFYPLAGFLIVALGWRSALHVLAGMQLLVALPLHAVILRRHPEDVGLHPDGAPARGRSTPQSGVTLRAAMRTTAFWLLTGAIALSFFASTIVLTEHIAYLIALGYAPAFAASLAGLFGIAYLPGRWFVAHASGKVPLAVLFAIVFGAEALGVALLATLHALAGVIAYVLTFGAAYGATAPLRGAIVAERFGRRSYGAIIAAQGVPIGVLAALGPVVAGRLIDVAGYGPALWCCVGALTVAAVVVAVPVRGPA
jgi:MFS family permease